MDLTHDTRLWFGKWKDERLADVPDEYFEWLKQQPGFKFKYPALWRWMTKNENDSDTSNSDQLLI